MSVVCARTAPQAAARAVGDSGGGRQRQRQRPCRRMSLPQPHHRTVHVHHQRGGSGGGHVGPHSSSIVRRSSVHVLKEESEEAILQEWGQAEARRCDDGDPDIELCELPGIIDTPPLLDRGAVEEAWSRGRWLLGLLLLQSLSSFVLDSYQQLLKDHLVVTLFLTMLVGAGGNAGNQSAIKVIRGLATGALQPTRASVSRMMRQQAAVGLMLGTGLAAGGFVRVLLTTNDVSNSLAISLSLFMIVVTSVVAGTGLPFALAKVGVDPANAGTSIQVFMDVLGVVITCATCHLVLDQLSGILETSSVAVAVTM